jgi:hypothetical protein
MPASLLTPPDIDVLAGSGTAADIIKYSCTENLGSWFESKTRLEFLSEA